MTDEALADEDAQLSSFVESAGFTALMKLANPSDIILGRKAGRVSSIVYMLKLELCHNVCHKKC